MSNGIFTRFEVIILEEIDAQKYVSKFYFMKIDHACTSRYRQRVLADLYLKELKIEIFDEFDKMIDTFGYPLETKINELLPLLEWEEYEKNRDKPGWDMKNDYGYRDGWGYDFLCSNESGHSLIRSHLDVTFSEKNKPAYEKLLDWVITNYSNKKEIKKYKLFW